MCPLHVLPIKESMKRHEILTFLTSVYTDACERSSTMFKQRDIDRINDRYLYEGLSFLTISLPKFASDMMLCLEAGSISPLHFIGWKKRNGIPVFLGEFLNLVFEQNTLVVRDDASYRAIESIRQICLMFKKLDIKCTRKRELLALKEYISIDDELAVSQDHTSGFDELSAILWSNVFPDIPDTDEFICHHGPGTTQEKLVGNQKYDMSIINWPSRLDNYFHMGNVVFANCEHLNLSCSKIEEHSDWSMPPVRVVTVPKTQTAPRVIAVEPVVLQLTQQSIKDYIVNILENHPLTKGHINFEKQSVNQSLALSSSKDLKYATLDLSAASDRVHKEYVYRMLSVNPALRDLVFVTRSDFAEVEALKSIVLLNKFASMGSALCFPIESMFFYTLCIKAILDENKLKYSLANIKLVKDNVFIYGDDIIIPTYMVDAVCKTLSDFGNVVGLSKSFYKSKFRESCGVEAYNGYNITPIYFRRTLPDRKDQIRELVSLVSTGNQLHLKSYFRASEWCKNHVERIIGNLPHVPSNSAGLGWHYPGSNKNVKQRYNAKLQLVEVKTYVVSPVVKFDPLDGYGAFHKCILKLEMGKKIVKDEDLAPWRRERNMLNSINFSSSNHLEWSTRYGALTLKHRWIPLENPME